MSLSAGASLSLTACGGPGPPQPIDFSHRLHAGAYEISCVYCHTGAERTEVARLPALRTCLDCHDGLKRSVPELEAIRRAVNEGRSVAWVQVHDLPDHVVFDHGAHDGAGVPCASCHGEVAAMDRVKQVSGLSMGWCLDCHRGASVLRVKGGGPPVFLEDGSTRAVAVTEQSGDIRVERPSTDCATCHR